LRGRIVEVLSMKLKKLKAREERRDRTIRYGERARKLHLRRVHPNGVVDCVCEFSAWKFAKGKSLGCGCRRRGRGCSPKVVASMCHDGRGGYHPSTMRRIEGKRLVKKWLQATDALDVEA
jgi:hypothetical protein